MSRSKYHFRIRTSNGGIVGNITKEAKSLADAEVKLRRQYPDCEILDVQVS
ncbi:hypothetical protein [Thalassotalea ganghwensis]